MHALCVEAVESGVHGTKSNGIQSQSGEVIGRVDTMVWTVPGPFKD